MNGWRFLFLMLYLLYNHNEDVANTLICKSHSLLNGNPITDLSKCVSITAWNRFCIFTVKIGQAYPSRFYYWIDYLKNESVSRFRNWCQIQSGISACVMSSEYFTRTSLYLVRLKIFEWIKFLRRHLHQIQENGAGRNFITASRVNSRLITHARVLRSIWNLQLPTDSTFE